MQLNSDARLMKKSTQPTLQLTEITPMAWLFFIKTNFCREYQIKMNYESVITF